MVDLPAIASHKAHSGEAGGVVKLGNKKRIHGQVFWSIADRNLRINVKIF